MIRECGYLNGLDLLAAGEPDSAIAAFRAIPGYKDSDTQLAQAHTQKGTTLAAAGKYAEAIAALAEAGEYQPAARQLRAVYDAAASAGEVRFALEAAAVLGDYSLVAALDLQWVAMGYTHAAALSPEGIVLAADKDPDRDFPSAGWTDIAAVSTGVCIAGLHPDGTVELTASDLSSASWRDIVQVAPCDVNNVFALTRDGTVLFAGYEWTELYALEQWQNIKQIAAGGNFVAALQEDGTVAYADWFLKEFGTYAWKGITAVAAGNSHMKEDGTVVATGYDPDHECLDVGDWTDIAAVRAGGDVTVGLKRDGTLVTTSAALAEEIAGWKDIVSFDADKNILAVDKHGTVHFAGKADKDLKEAIAAWGSVGIRAINAPAASAYS